MTLHASHADRKTVTDRLRQLLADIESEVFEIANEEIGTTTETLNCDRHDLQIALTEQAAAFHRQLLAYRVERKRLQFDHSYLEAEQKHVERLNAAVGYGHLHAELV